MTYDHRVRTVDSAGNVSGGRPVATVTTAAAPLTFATAADAMVEYGSPRTKHGTAALLETGSRTSVAMRSYLRFREATRDRPLLAVISG